MSPKSKMEYSKEVARRYLKIKGRKEKTKILDEFCATAVYNRKYAIDKLKRINFRDPPPQRRNRGKLYSGEADETLIRIWEYYGCLCAERLHPFLPEGIRKLEQFGHLHLSQSVKRELLSMSRPTIGRRIMGHQKRFGKSKGLSATKPGSLLKKHIPIKTSSWDEGRPGFTEIDLVAHCGGSLLGDLIYTLQAVDIKTTWTERVAVMGKSQKAVFAAIKKFRHELPFILRGIDSDNGSEFINDQLWKYCQKEDIAFTRSRPYMSKDNAHIEQKNWPLVRKILGYDRFDTQFQLHLINDLYDNELRLYLNFFQPTMKLAEKTRVGAKIKRRHDTPRTPYQRVLECPEVSEETKEKLRKLYATLDPVKLKKAIERKVDRIIKTVRVSEYPQTSKNALNRKYEGLKINKKTKKG